MQLRLVLSRNLSYFNANATFSLMRLRRLLIIVSYFNATVTSIS